MIFFCRKQVSFLRIGLLCVLLLCIAGFGITARPAGAQTTGTNQPNKPAPQPAPAPAPAPSPVNAQPSSAPTQLINLSRFNSVPDLVFGIINYALIMLGIITTLMIIYGGFLMVLSAGNEERLNAGRKTLTWAIIGFALALLSFSIVAIVQNVLQRGS